MELKFAQEMTAGFAHLEGVLGLAKGLVSVELDSHLDRICSRTPGDSGRRSRPRRFPRGAGSRKMRLSLEAIEYVLPRGDFHCGEKHRDGSAPGEAARTVAFRIDPSQLSQSSDGTVTDELGVRRSVS